MNELAISNMTIIRRNFRLASVRAAIFILVVLLVGCSPTSLPPSEVGKGSSKEDVIASLGNPIRPKIAYFSTQKTINCLFPRQ